MSKVKNYYWDLAEKESDTIINDYVENKISKDDAIKQLSNVQNIELCGIDEYNVDEVLDIAKSETVNDYYFFCNRDYVFNICCRCD